MLKNKKLITSTIIILSFCLFLIFTINSKTILKTNNVSQYNISKDYVGLIPKSIIYKKDPVKEIEKIIGQENIIPKIIDFAEGEESPGYILFPNSSNAVDLIINDRSIYFRIPSWDSLEGEINWTTQEGIAIDTSIEYVEKINGRPFSIAGYGWDYSGITLGWNNGEINPDLILFFRLTEDIKKLETEYNQIIGDQDIGSTNPALRKFNPQVSAINVYWAKSLLDE